MNACSKCTPKTQTIAMQDTVNPLLLVLCIAVTCVSIHLECNDGLHFNNTCQANNNRQSKASHCVPINTNTQGASTNNSVNWSGCTSLLQIQQKGFEKSKRYDTVWLHLVDSRSRSYLILGTSSLIHFC